MARLSVWEIDHDGQGTLAYRVYDIFAMVSPLFMAAEARGRRLFALLEARLRNPDGVDVSKHAMEQVYDVDWFSVDPDLEKAVQAEFSTQGISSNEALWTCCSARDFQLSKAAYFDYFSPIKGSIICMNHDKSEDHTDIAQRLDMSEIIFQSYHLEAVLRHVSCQTLRTIWRYYIINQDSMDLIDETRRAITQPDDIDLWTEILPSENGFFALLGSPNGGSVVHMLIDHCQGLGCKSIECIRIPRRLDEHDLCFTLDDAIALGDHQGPKTFNPASRKSSK